MTADYRLKFQERVVNEVDLGLYEISRGGTSQGILLLGGSGTGKTHALDIVAGLYPDWMDGRQPVKPCCRLETDASVSESRLVSAITAHLGKTGSSSERDMFNAIRARRTNIFIFEQFDHALLVGTRSFRAKTGRFIKNLWNMRPNDSPTWAYPEPNHPDWRVLIILSATEKLLPVILQDDELASRFGCVIEAERLQFWPDDSFQQFRLVLKAMFERHGLDLDANDESLAARCLFACQSHLRELNNILQRARTLKTKSRGTGPMLLLLATACDRVTSRTIKGGANPFGWSEDKLRDEVLEEIEKLKKKLLKAGRK